jgi:hypothetical protein
MTSSLTKEWLRRNDQVLRDRHLLMDSFTGHKTADVVEHLMNHSSIQDYSIIPPRSTSQLQPLDVGINKPFKDRLRNKWNQWNETTSVNERITTKGNYKSVPVLKLLEWVKEAWNEISTLTILNSFRKAFQVTTL